MLDIPEIGKSLYMDGFLYEALSRAKRVIKKDWDMIFLVDGGERSGKSVLAQQCAAIFYPSLSLNEICFTPEEFKHAVTTAQPYSAVIYDEAYSGLSSRSAMSQINKTLVSLLAEIGQKNLIIFVVMPTFFDLDRYAAIWRSRALLHVYTGDDFERGYFAFYNIDRKKLLYIEGKKYYNYKTTKPNFVGRFANGYIVDEVAYRKKKKDSLTHNTVQVTTEEEDARFKQRMFKYVALSDSGLTHDQKIALLKMKRPTYYNKLKQIKQENQNGAQNELRFEDEEQNEVEQEI